jgi:hypothetical protein
VDLFNERSHDSTSLGRFRFQPPWRFTVLGGKPQASQVIFGLNNNALGATCQTNLSFHLRSFGLTSEPTSRAELWPSSGELTPHREDSRIWIGVRARKTEGRVGAISWRKPICAREWTRRRLRPFFGDPASGSNIFLLRSTDDGETWIGPQQVNPTVTGEPRHVYPAIAIERAGQQVDVSYYTQHADGTADLDLASTGRSSKFTLGKAARVTSQSFDLVPSNVPIPTPTTPFRTTNFDRNIVPCYDLGEYVGLFNNKGNVYASWGDNRNQVTEPSDPLDPLSGQTHAQADNFFQKVKPLK